MSYFWKHRIDISDVSCSPWRNKFRYTEVASRGQSLNCEQIFFFSNGQTDQFYCKLLLSKVDIFLFNVWSFDLQIKIVKRIDFVHIFDEKVWVVKVKFVNAIFNYYFVDKTAKTLQIDCVGRDFFVDPLNDRRSISRVDPHQVLARPRQVNESRIFAVDDGSVWCATNPRMKTCSR